MTLDLCGVDIENNEVNSYGSAIFFVSNNHDGTIRIEDSIIKNNINHSNHPWEILPGISGHEDTENNLCSHSQMAIDSDASCKPFELGALCVGNDEWCSGSSLSRHAQ